MSRICSDRLALAVAVCCGLAAFPAPATAQTVSGIVALVDQDGKAPKKPDYSGTVVWLESAAGAPRAAPAPLQQATMSQRNKTFLPHLLVVEVGTAVDFPNDDPIFHNVFSNYDGQVFDVQLYEPKTTRRVVFRRPGIVHVFCNVHETMNAAIAVLPTPYFAIAGRDGRFQIRAPAGQYRLHVWHERVDTVVAARAERTVTLGAADTAIPDLALPVSDQPVTHKNKYGQSYAFAPSDSVFYPGARR